MTADDTRPDEGPDLACRFCQHAQNAHNGISGCPYCRCLATRGEADPRTDAELDAALLPAPAVPVTAPGDTLRREVDELRHMNDEQVKMVRQFAAERDEAQRKVAAIEALIAEGRAAYVPPSTPWFSGDDLAGLLAGSIVDEFRHGYRCEDHPDREMSHDGCGGAGIPAPPADDTLRRAAQALLDARGHMCKVCYGLSPSWDGHDKNPPCETQALADLRAALAADRTPPAGDEGGAE